MIFDGLKFIHSAKHVILPMKFWLDGKTTFAKIAKPNAKNAIQLDNGMWVVLVEPDGHGSTNKMYGKDGKIYLAKDGQVYINK